MEGKFFDVNSNKPRSDIISYNQIANPKKKDSEDIAVGVNSMGNSNLIKSNHVNGLGD